MSSIWSLMFCILVTMNINLSSASIFRVCERIGWRMPNENETAMYSQWAAKNRFLVGDSLLFEYKNDSVLVVNKGGYYHCNITNPNITYTDGKTVIKLDNPGPAYFISGAPDHCKNGQRLLIDVMTLHPPSPPSPSPPSTGITPKPVTTTSPAPSPGQGSVTSIGAVTSVVSVLLVLSTIGILV